MDMFITDCIRGWRSKVTKQRRGVPAPTVDGRNPLVDLATHGPARRLRQGIHRSYVEEDVYRLKRPEFRLLRPQECVVVHANKQFRRCVLPPLEPDGHVSRWFPWWRKWLP